ncbi:MAG: RsmB/NOP family class I SAM-dependent RNA methyltransferase [Lentisphaeria bacterium]|nr:RsmB/NOP family class I SAM-dependent RNA methyltransferase [Lentisphaeria bacterium]
MSSKHNVKSVAGKSLSAVIEQLGRSKDEQALPRIFEQELGALLQNLLLVISRHRCSFDFLLAQHCRKKIRPQLRQVFWWALAEWFFLDALTAPNIVNIAVEHVKQHCSRQEAGFVNAILRQLTKLPRDSSYLRHFSQVPEHVQLELPSELYSCLQKSLTPQQLRHCAALWQQPSSVFLRRCAGVQAPPPPSLEKLAPFNWAPNSEVYLYRPDNDSSLRQILAQPGQYYAQDPSTLLAPTMLDAKPGEILGDLCAAPGGKALMLAEALQGKGQLYCRDRSENRLELLRQNLQQHENVQIEACDALQPDLPEESLDAVLLDLPCSNTGVIGRRPDLRWTFSRRKLQELIVLQAEVCRQSLRLLRPGGRLVYSTCSLDKKENEEQVAAILKNNPGLSLIKEQKLLPDKHNDGAYAALLHKGEGH